MQTIIGKAWEDKSFKQALIDSPIEAIKKATGETVIVPEGKRMVVRDQTNESVIYINIPAEPKLDDVELSEEQLEAVAGGMSILKVAPILCFPSPITLPSLES